MERSGPGFYEADDEENDFNSVEVESPQPTFAERLKEIFDLEDEDDEEEPDGKKKGVFRRLFSKIPGVVDIDKAEEAPDASKTVERPFSLPFLGSPETSDEETLVAPHEVEASVIHPEATISDDSDFEELVADLPEQLLEEEAEEEPDQPTLQRTQPLQQQATSEVADDTKPEADVDEEPTAPIPTTHSAYGPPPPKPPSEVIAAAEPTVVETDDFATHRQATRKATLAGAVGVGAAIVANSRAKSREQELEQRTEDRQAELNKTVESNKQQTEQHLTQLRRQLEDERSKVGPTPRVVEQPKAENQPVQQPAEQAQKLQSNAEVYSPDVHDRIPPKIAFEKLTGIEQPLPRSLEQERRHEVKDDPSKVPQLYTQVDQHPTETPTNTIGRHSARSNLMNLNPMPAPSPQPVTPQKTLDPTYKKAAVSGIVTGLVILGALIAFAALR